MKEHSVEFREKVLAHNGKIVLCVSCWNTDCIR